MGDPNKVLVSCCPHAVGFVPEETIMTISHWAGDIHTARLRYFRIVASCLI